MERKLGVYIQIRPRGIAGIPSEVWKHGIGEVIQRFG